MPRMTVVLTYCVVLAASTAIGGDLRSDFATPPFESQSRPLWFWNAPPSAAETRAIMEGSKGVGYAGFGILPAQDKDGFMTPAFLDAYAAAVETAAALGQKMCLYDEYWFPSGSAGGQLAKDYPEALSKRLDKWEKDVRGPKAFSQTVPEGTLMAAVAMHTETRARVDLTITVKNGRLEWAVPEGTWKIMIFTCVPDGSDGLVDYLDPNAVAKFVSLTYEKYYARLSTYFGNTIDSAFFDEPTLYRTQGARTWTPAFNGKFFAKYKFNPAPLYPALWYDIGPDTAAARCALFGFRAELYSNGFMRVLDDWCRAHGIRLTGHQDQEEIVNPTGICGDLIQSFAHQEIPGIDQISKYNRAGKVYKLVSSAAYNYGRPHVMTECYGAMDNLPVANLYKEAMDQFAKGINMMIPHAVWYDPKHITFQPELSYRTEPYASALPAYNAYIGRLQRVLQHGRHEADIAVLYPIATLQAGYRFGVGEPYTGGIVPPEADYLDVGEMLSDNVRAEFTFLHPESLEAHCAVAPGGLHFEVPGHFEDYRVLVLPGAETANAGAMAKAAAFFAQGGKILATTRVPSRSAEFSQDADVRNAATALFGAPPETVNAAMEPFVWNNDAGGKAIFVPRPTPEALQAALDTLLPVRDLVFGPVPPLDNGRLTYLHKNVDGMECYFVANSSDTPVETEIRLRGGGTLECWNPHTGEITPLESRRDETSGEAVTTAPLSLPPVQSRMIMAK